MAAMAAVRSSSAPARPSPAAARAPRLALISAGELFGGVEQFIFTYAVYLRRVAGAPPTVILFHRGRLHQTLVSAGIDTVLVPASVAAVRRALVERNIELVHAHGYKGAVLGALACRGTCMRVVKTEHGAVEPYRGWKRLKMAVYDRLDRWVTGRFIDRVAYITDDLRRHKRVTGRAREAVVIPNGVPLFSTVRPAGPRADDTFTIGIVGRLSPIKGHRVLLDALEALPERRGLRVLVLGDGPLMDSLQADSARRGLSDAVHFLGFQKDPHSWMVALDLLVMPSFNEGLPYTLLEAMHLGVPVVASKVGGMRENLDEGRTAVLVPPGDARALAAAINTLRNDPTHRAALAAAARAEARQRFEIGAMAERYRDFYGLALGAPR
jgi:glycosyltransferase involved in cell wall biosynthesis